MSLDRYSAVRYAARFSVVAKYLSQLYGLLGLLTTVPALVALLSGNVETALVFLLVITALLGCAVLGRMLPSADHLQRNEAAAVVSLAFVTSSLFLSLPIMTYGVDFTDAWFEAVSGVTTTGLSTLDLSDKPAAFLFARGWSQWVGGIGVVVLALAVLLRSGHAARNLGFSRLEIGDAVGGTKAHARRVVIIYLTLTAVGILALLLAGAAPLDAVVHSMTAVSTGGFANHPVSLGGSGALEVGVINGLCVAGAISFHVYYSSLFNFRRGKRLDSQLFGLLGILVVSVLLAMGLSVLLGAKLEWLDVITLVVSAQTTAGFSTTDISLTPDWFVVLLCLAMFVGGGIGSTSGGIKLGRLLFVFTWMRSYFVTTTVPESAYTDVRVAGQRVSGDDLQEVFAVLGAFVLVLYLSWFVFVLWGYPPLPALFEVLSALSTAGLSAGITDATLPTPLKYVLGFDMLFGRVEVVALVVVLLPGTWIGRRQRLSGSR